MMGPFFSRYSITPLLRRLELKINKGRVVLWDKQKHDGKGKPVAGGKGRGGQSTPPGRKNPARIQPVDKCERDHDPKHPRAKILGTGAGQKQKAAQGRRGMREIDRAKEDPRQANPINRQEPGKPADEGLGAPRRSMLLHLADIRKNILPPSPGAMGDQGEPMQPAPDHESPGAP